jgi:thiol-disulfide isomerase/thioredoxin
MSATAPRPRRGSSRGRRQAESVARRRRRRGFGAGGVAVLAVAGTVIGLHYANPPSNSAAVAGSSAIPAVGKPAPRGTFTTLAGRTVRIGTPEEHPTLVWFVSTWCSSCQAGTQTMASYLPKLAADGVKVDEVELYADLGQSGPTMASFAQRLAGPEATNPDWTFVISSASLTRTYDPQSYLDIYYLLDAQGRVTYVNGSPGSTMPQLLAAAGKLA